MKITGTVSVFLDEVDLEQAQLENADPSKSIMDRARLIQACCKDDHFNKYENICAATGHRLEYIRTIDRLMPRGKEAYFKVAEIGGALSDA